MDCILANIDHFNKVQNTIYHPTKLALFGALLSTPVRQETKVFVSGSSQTEFLISYIQT